MIFFQEAGEEIMREGKLQEIIERIKRNPKVVAIILFGSYARGEAKPISDMDIAVLIKDPDREDEADIGSLCSRIIDVVLFHRLPLYIKYEVLKTGKELWVRDEEELMKEKMRVMRKYLEMERLYRRMAEELMK